MVAQITFVRAARRVRPSSSAFAHADILSRLGETISDLVAAEILRRIQADIDALPPLSEVASVEAAAAVEAAHGACEFDEDPERWDGLS